MLCNGRAAHKGATLAVCITSGTTEHFRTEKSLYYAQTHTHCTARRARSHTHSHLRSTACHAVPRSVHGWCISNRVPIRLIHFPCWRVSLPFAAVMKVHTHMHSTSSLTQLMLHYIITETFVSHFWLLETISFQSSRQYFRCLNFQKIQENT